MTVGSCKIENRKNDIRFYMTSIHTISDITIPENEIRFYVDKYSILWDTSAI